MSKKYNGNLITRAKQLRKNATKQERHLWYDFLKSYPVRFQRQKTIDNYIVDFYCDKAKIAIELDGSQHYDEQAEVYDTERTKRIEQYGIEVVRYTNLDIDRNFEGVCQDIDNKVKASQGSLSEGSEAALPIPRLPS